MIRLTKQTDYAIVLMSQIADSEQPRHTAAELAEETLLPQPMVSKILKLLARGRLLESHRGAKGGYSLTLRPEEVSVAAIIASSSIMVEMLESQAEGISTQQLKVCSATEAIGLAH